MVSAADDDRDAFGDTHSAHMAAAGQVEPDPQGLRAGERDGSLLEREVGVTGASRKDRTVADEGDQPGGSKLLSQGLLVPVEADMFGQGCCLEVLMLQRERQRSAAADQ